MTAASLHDTVVDLSSLERRSPSVLGHRRRVEEDELAERIVALIRRNQALDDFASLVAHELKGSLLAATSGDPDAFGRAVDLIDDLLKVARSEGDLVWGQIRRGLEDALCDLPKRPSAIEFDIAPAFPLPQPLLRVILRNVIANAVAAGAETVRVSSRPGGTLWTLSVEDDGVGLGVASAGHPDANGIGLALCRRIVERCGGSLELDDSSRGGARVTITLPGAIP